MLDFRKTIILVFEASRDSLMDSQELNTSSRTTEHEQRSVYQPQRGDVVLVTYPKCGTHWVQQLIQLIMNGGESAVNYFEFLKRTPRIEETGGQILEELPCPRFLRTHLPLDLIRFNEDAKFVYVARNPWDCCVSFYYHCQCWPWCQYKGATFDHFFNSFLGGEVYQCGFFDHVLPWYHLRKKSNVLFLTYEGIAEDPRSIVLQLAKFLGKEYELPLLQEGKLLGKILEKSSSSFMRELFACNHARFEVLLEKDPNVMNGIPKLFKDYFYETISASKANDRKEANIVRKGIVGDFSTHFTKDQLRMMKIWIEKKTSGSDIMKLWSGIDKLK